jgi:predicted Ser/Thr protein kinase
MENRVLGRCRLVRKLGEGGMGVVWLARHETLEKDVAVKVLPPGFAADPEAVQRFLREARAAARIDHPNVVPVLDAGSADGVPYIVMAYVEGTDLQKILARRGRLSVGDALAIAKKVAQALGAAHRLGLVHRDIKPSNILVTRQGRVMVTDFGLARDVGAGATVTAADEIVGTPQFLSPEQARGEKIDGRSDLYSLGATLYALLAGRPPYGTGSAVSIVLKHADPKERPQPLRSAVPDIPPEVEGLVEKLMAKRPEERFQTADEVVAAVDRVKRGDGGTLVTVTEDKVLTPQRRRRLILAGAGVGVAGLLGLVLFLAVLGPGPAERAFRAAGTARTEAERILRYKEVAARFPGTEWAERAGREAEALRRKALDREIDEALAPDRDGRVSLGEALARLDLVRARYPEGAAEVDRREQALHRARLLERTKDFAGRLKTLRRGEGHRLQDLVSPEVRRKVGEGGVSAWLGFAVGVIHELAGRPEQIEVLEGGVEVENRRTGSVPYRAVLYNERRQERFTQSGRINWIWQEGDWYLSEKPVESEK